MGSSAVEGPLRAYGRRGVHQAGNLVIVARAQRGAQRAQRRFELCQLLQHFITVGTEDVAPDAAGAAGNAAEVPKARSGQRQVARGIGLLGHRVDIGKGQEVGQVADGGKRLVVLLCAHVHHGAAHGLPQGLRAFKRGWGVFRQGGEDAAPVLVQRGLRLLNATVFLSCNRVGGYELPRSGAQRRPCCSHHIALRGSHIHHQGIGAKDRAHSLQCRFGGGHRHGHEHQVGLLHRLRGAGAHLVHDAQGLRTLAAVQASAVPADDNTRAGCAQRQCKRATHQPAADQCQVLTQRRRLRRKGVGHRQRARP